MKSTEPQKSPRTPSSKSKVKAAAKPRKPKGYKIMRSVSSALWKN